MDTKRILDSVGMKTFVDCFDARHSQGMDLNQSKVSGLCSPDSDNWKDVSLNTKTSILNRIFRENRQWEALKLCCGAERLDAKARKEAITLYEKFCV